MIFIPLCQLSLKSSLFSKRRLGQDPTNAKGRLKPTGAMRSTICCICPLPKPSATTTTSTATVPPPSCPTADRSTTCITAAATCTKSASTTKSSPTSNATSCTAEIYCTQGKLASRYELDPLGRLKRQIAAINELTQTETAKNAVTSVYAVNRSYAYDKAGNLTHRELADGEVQNYFYDLHDQLVKAEIFKKDCTKETWTYTYDALGRRIGKRRLKNEEVSDGLEEEIGFVWDGSHLLQEIQPDGRYTYLYTDPDSYEPLAQVRNWTTEGSESRQQTHYFHCDQIGIPREMTDKDGNLLWFGNYTGWGRLKEETKVTDSAYQPFRLQNQYADLETGLHYNFFRYYEPNVGRFVNQDPIGLWGGSNFYQFALNMQRWIDVLGLTGKCQNCPPGTMPTKDIHFMQSSAKNQTGDYTVLQNAADLKSGKLDPNILRVNIWKDESGKTWTLDHRRLAAFKIAKIECTPVQEANSSMVKKQMWKMTTKTEGKSMTLKLGNSKNLIVR